MLHAAPDTLKTTPDSMNAIALDDFGGGAPLEPRSISVPDLGDDEVLIRVQSAGVGVWDPAELDGYFAELYDAEPRFPYVPGFDGAGIVAAVGDDVRELEPGDRVYAAGQATPGRGFYAEYAVAKAENTALIPAGLSVEQAGAMPVDGVTALQGLDDTLELREGESVLIFGAGGGVGHLAVQLAKRMGARVFAVASGEDGVALVGNLGADAVVDGREGDVLSAAREFAPDGIDKALITAGGDTASLSLEALREGGRAAYPNGVRPEPRAPEGVTLTAYDGIVDAASLARLNGLIAAEGVGLTDFSVHVARAWPLSEAADAHRALDGHYLGKLALRP